MSTLEMLEIYKADAMEQLAENNRVIAGQKERIEELEFHLNKCRDVAYQIMVATAGVVPLVYSPDTQPTKKQGAKNDRLHSTL